MLDLSLFRRPAFTGASIVAFTLSGSFFAMFLYLTLYIQDVLGYSPFQAGLRFLPSTLLSFIVAPIAGRLSVRMPVRLLLGSGLVLIGIGLLAMTTIDATSTLDRADPRLHPRRRGRRPGQPAARLHRDRRGARRALGDGLGDQLDLPPGRDRHGHRRPGRRVPAQRHPRHHGRAVARAGRRARSSAPPTASWARCSSPAKSTKIAHSLSAAARAALEHSYRVGFTEAFTTIALIAAMLALVGGVLAFVLVRSRDFVSAGELPAAQAPEPVAVAAG